LRRSGCGATCGATSVSWGSCELEGQRDPKTGRWRIHADALCDYMDRRGPRAPRRRLEDHPRFQELEAEVGCLWERLSRFEVRLGIMEGLLQELRATLLRSMVCWRGRRSELGEGGLMEEGSRPLSFGRRPIAFRRLKNAFQLVENAFVGRQEQLERCSRARLLSWPVAAGGRDREQASHSMDRSLRVSEGDFYTVRRPKLRPLMAPPSRSMTGA
jgi:hypothetical protein